MRDVPGFAEHLVRFSYLCRDGETRVVHADEEFEPGDRVVVIGPAGTGRRGGRRSSASRPRNTWPTIGRLSTTGGS